VRGLEYSTPDAIATLMKPVIAITMGDPAGIGPEIIARAMAIPLLHRLCVPVVCGDTAVLKRAVRLARISIPVEQHSLVRSKTRDHQPVLRVINSTKVDLARMEPGRPTADTGRAAYECIETAVRMTMKGETAAITTAPLSKTGLAAAGLPYPGHTEMLAAMSGSTEVGMLMVAPFVPPRQRRKAHLRILLVTTHTAHHAVSGALSIERVLAAIRLAHLQAGPLFGLEQPKVAVAALNPHAGEDGLFGPEEATIILPAILEGRKQGLATEGPFPADSLMARAVKGRYDFVIAMYHDQAMIPVKMLAFGRGVNVTVGLPFVRTSVDHGTAFDIAWKGKADPGSLVEAIRMATQLYRNFRQTTRTDAS
jgi:4-phospho-D-threonate 3-dehydrogenase / 4-phospho-D-erythronate 3-dehydrogenase